MGVVVGAKPRAERPEPVRGSSRPDARPRGRRRSRAPGGAMISRQENIRSPFAEQLPQRDAGSRRVSRPGTARACRHGAPRPPPVRSRARRQEGLDPWALPRPRAARDRPSSIRAVRPVPATMGCGTCRRPGSLRRSGQCAARARGRDGPLTQSFPVAQEGQRLVLGRPERQAQRHAPIATRHPQRKPLGPADRRNTTSTGGSPGRTWVDAERFSTNSQSGLPSGRPTGGKGFDRSRPMADDRNSLDSDD
jgi:hypothetical protein